jgi:translation initiation factor IF-1
MKEEMIEVAGLVIDKQRGSNFKVKVNKTEHYVWAQISGRMRRNRIRILIGDKVDLEMSPYDLTKGRITYRHK